MHSSLSTTTAEIINIKKEKRIYFIVIAVSLIAVCVERYAISIKVPSVCEFTSQIVKIILRGIGRGTKSDDTTIAQQA